MKRRAGPASTQRLLLTLGAHAQRGLRVCVSVCLCVTQNLTNDMTYLTGNEGQNIVPFSLKMFRCRARAIRIVASRPCF